MAVDPPEKVRFGKFNFRVRFFRKRISGVARLINLDLMAYIVNGGLVKIDFSHCRSIEFVSRFRRRFFTLYWISLTNALN